MKAERADYFDAGISQQILPGLKVGVDGYYKKRQESARRRLVRAGADSFGVQLCGRRCMARNSRPVMIRAASPAYANVAYSVAQGKGWNSAQFSVRTRPDCGLCQQSTGSISTTTNGCPVRLGRLIFGRSRNEAARGSWWTPYTAAVCGRMAGHSTAAGIEHSQRRGRFPNYYSRELRGRTKFQNQQHPEV